MGNPLFGYKVVDVNVVEPLVDHVLAAEDEKFVGGDRGKVGESRFW